MSNSETTNNEPKVANYGTWDSPITKELITEGVKFFSDVCIDGSDIYWNEMRPFEMGRNVIVRCDKDQNLEDITPAEDVIAVNTEGKTDANIKIFNVRTKVQEYGGSSFAVKDKKVYFVNFSDQRVYVQDLNNNKISLPLPLTKEGVKFADLQICDHGIIAIGEISNKNVEKVENFIALINTSTGEWTKIVSGNDFYAYPTLSPDQTKLAWIEWQHPNMPWDNTELWFADVNFSNLNFADDSLIDIKTNLNYSKIKVAGNNNESIVEPLFKDNNTLFFVSDRNNWWNIYKYEIQNKALINIYQTEAEFSGPTWIQGIRSYGFLNDQIIANVNKGGFNSLCLLTKKNKLTIQDAEVKLKNVNTKLTFLKTDINIDGNEFNQLKVGDDFAVVIRNSAHKNQDIIKLDFGSDDFSTNSLISSFHTNVLAKSAKNEIDIGYISEPQQIEFTSKNNRKAYALYYPPKNKNFIGRENTLPPLMVKIHGGPTACASPSYSTKVQFWTSRGFAFVDVNYGGSTGFGRKYRELLKGNWGIVDVDDCEAAAKYLVEKNLVDKNKLVIRGGSAGGFTTLACLALKNIFSVGAVYYGVSDLIALTKDTHKFESHYLDTLIGEYPKQKELYDERSPINHADKLNVPVIFFQGDEDKVVPLNQATTMYEALKKQGIKTKLVIYEGEQHGFRKAENIQDALTQELEFYMQVFYT